MNNYFSIGELSKLQNISRQTLIFYDKIGLFTPAYINPENGYRYYNANQLDYLDTICIMKKIGFSLEEIKEHMKNYTLDSSVIDNMK
ncbi:MAG: MerR family transcriptional regulator [Erysipelotrichaceae bacterium]|nr:MerR family transcriptional regulator [Solobacterium sp.]MDY3793478.1 MerR family transcriptional regulator [Erysipelotrichaceae bacterium]